MSTTVIRRPHAVAVFVMAACAGALGCGAAGPEGTAVDLIVTNAHVVTMNDRRVCKLRGA